MSAASPNTKFILGIFLILCGWVICFDVFHLVIGIAFFLLGTIIVLFSKKSILVKIVTVGLPIILWIVAFELILNAINTKPAISIVIPYHFKGQFRIIDGIQGGIIPGKKDGKIELNIPESGILILQSHLPGELPDVGFFEKDAKGNEFRIGRMENDSDKSALRPAVFFQGTLSSTSSDPNVSPDSFYTYNSFYVFQNDSDKMVSFLELAKNDILADSLVKAIKHK